MGSFIAAQVLGASGAWAVFTNALAPQPKPASAASVADGKVPLGVPA